MTGRRSHVLFAGLAFLIGIALRLQRPELALIAAFGLLWIARPRWVMVLIVVLGIGYGALTVREPQGEVTGRACITFTSIAQLPHSRGGGWVVRGKLLSIESGGEIVAHHLPVSLFFSRKQGRPKGDCSYRIEGRLIPKQGGRYRFKPTGEWEGLNGWKSAELRYSMKKGLERRLGSHFRDQTSATFLSGLLTGHFADEGLTASFGRLGMQHLMAISGFHFSVIALLCALLFRPWFTPRVGSIVVVAGLTLYFLFVGFMPSVERAWAMALVALLAPLVGRRGSGWNALGVALFLVLLLDPLACRSLGFQFSFLCTGAILVLYPPVEEGLRRGKRLPPVAEMVHWPLFRQHLVLVSTFFRHALALNLAVHLVAIPATLLYFHRFNWLGLFYNLFYPCLVSLLMVALVLTLVVTTPFPFLAFLFRPLEWLTRFALGFACEVPLAFDMKWRVRTFSPALFIAWIVVLFGWGIYNRGGGWYGEIYERSRRTLLQRIRFGSGRARPLPSGPPVARGADPLGRAPADGSRSSTRVV